MGLERQLRGPLRTLLRLGGDDVTYRRGEESFAVRVMPADQERPADREQGFVREWWERDWIGFLADLVLEGELITPQVDDQIEITSDEDVTEIWQVSALPNGQCWEPLAANREAFRMHTVRVE